MGGEKRGGGGGEREKGAEREWRKEGPSVPHCDLAALDMSSEVGSEGRQEDWEGRTGVQALRRAEDPPNRLSRLSGALVPNMHVYPSSWASWPPSLLSSLAAGAPNPAAQLHALPVISFDLLSHPTM